MKKLLILLTIFMMSKTSFGQIYKSIQYYDKFDDVLKTENIKTLVTKTDSTFIVEVKGRKPVEYWIINYANYNSMGDEDNIVDLNGKSVYGYQDSWCVIKKSDKEEYSKMLERRINNEI